MLWYVRGRTPLVALSSIYPQNVAFILLMRALGPVTFKAAWCVMLKCDGATTSELREGSSGRVLNADSGEACTPSLSGRVQDTAELISS